jgi:pSer/pThr/pTyr-binding forkhead associated (FHA) protein
MLPFVNDDDLVINDPYVSGGHVLVTVDDLGQVTIRDLNSTGGTFVNGKQVLEPGDKVQLAGIVVLGTPPRTSGHTPRPVPTCRSVAGAPLGDARLL